MSLLLFLIALLTFSKSNTDALFLQSNKPSVVSKPPTPSFENKINVPYNGIIDYIGRTEGGSSRWATESFFPFVPANGKLQFKTKFNLWKQAFWKKIKGPIILKAKVGGSLPLENTPR